MAFNLEEFKNALLPFGTLTYASIFNEGLSPKAQVIFSILMKKSLKLGILFKLKYILQF